MAEAQGELMRRLQAVDDAQLTPLVRKALGSDTVTIGPWTHEAVGGGVGGAMFDTFIYRFSGQGDDQGKPAAWSLILKILSSRKGEEPSSTHYWRREAEVYRSGLVDDLPGELRAARCFGVSDFADEACWLWLEDVQESVGRWWPLEHYRVAARHLGQFNGAYLAGRPLPAMPWLSSDWMRKIAARVEPSVPQIQTLLAQMPLRDVFPADAANTYSRLWNERELYLGALDRLPQTLCHLDAFRRNLIARRTSTGRDETVAIDWAFVGHAAVGTEIAVSMVVGLWLAEIEAADAQRLEAIVFDGYLDGLSDAGWRGDPQQVRLGYTAAVVMKSFELIQILLYAADPNSTAAIEAFSRRSLSDYIKHTAEIFRFVDSRAEEARALSSQ